MFLTNSQIKKRQIICRFTYFSKGILFVDARKSTPILDLYELQQESLLKGDTMRCVVTDASGKETGDYAVLIVDDLPDVPANRRHHWELSLI